MHESPIKMTAPLILLSFLSFAFVFTMNINPLKSKGWFKNSIGHIQHNFLDMHIIEEGIHHAHNQAMYLSLFVASIGIILSVIFYYLRKVDVDKITNIFNIIGLYNLSKNKFYIDKIYNTVLYVPFFIITKVSSFIDWNIYDQKIVDAWGWITLNISKYVGISDYSLLDQRIIDGTSHVTQYVSDKLRKTQSGVIQNYLLGVLAILVVFIIVINQI